MTLMIANSPAPLATALRPLTRGERVADGVIHVIGIAAGLIGAAMLVIAAATRGSPLELAALVTYSGRLLVAFAVSAAYQLLRSSRRRELLRCFDHTAIFLMIAGTYTPFTLLRTRPFWDVALTTAVWTIATTGIALRLLRPHVFDRVSVGFYLALGWAGLAAIAPLVPMVHTSTLVLLGAGGLLYTAGVAFHLWERLPFQNAIWHAFVLIAAAVHYAAVLEEIVGSDAAG